MANKRRIYVGGILDKTATTSLFNSDVAPQVAKGAFKYAVIWDEHAYLRGRDISAVWIDEAADMPEIRECVNLDPTTYFDFDRPTNRHQRRKDAAEARRSARRR